MKKIALVCLETINNGGDGILADTTRYLLSREGVQVVTVQLEPEYEERFGALSPARKLVYRLTRKFNNLTHGGTFASRRLFYTKLRARYFMERFRGLDGVVVAVGMLKFKTQKFSFLFEAVTRAAERLGIPVMFSAMSVARPDVSDKRFRQLRKAVNSPCVRMITTRDGEWGAERLKRHYISREGIRFDSVGDPGLWAPRVYGIAKRKSDVLGINVIRPEIFAAYGNRAGEKEMLGFCSGLIRRLESAGRPWALFTNGVERDHQFALKLLKTLGLDESRLMPRPQGAEELVRTVSRFGLVLGARLHACIAATALGIPAAGLLWDDKLRFFAKTLGRENCFTEVDEADPDRVLSLLSEAEKTPVDTDAVLRLALRTQEEIGRFAELVRREKLIPASEQPARPGKHVAELRAFAVPCKIHRVYNCQTYRRLAQPGEQPVAPVYVRHGEPAQTRAQ